MASSWTTDSDEEEDEQAQSVVSELGPVEAANIVKSEPMFYVLKEFLESVSGKNIATAIEELVTELRELKTILQAVKPATPA